MAFFCDRSSCNCCPLCAVNVAVKRGRTLSVGLPNSYPFPCVLQLKINGSKVVTTSPVPPTYFDTMWNVMNIAGTNYNNFDVMELHLTTLKTPGTASTMANVIFTASGNRPLKVSLCSQKTFLWWLDSVSSFPANMRN